MVKINDIIKYETKYGAKGFAKVYEVLRIIDSLEKHNIDKLIYRAVSLESANTSTTIIITENEIVDVFRAV